jgi:hypothetical protein
MNWIRTNGNIISLKRTLGNADLSLITGVDAHLAFGDDYAAAMAVL